MPTIPTRSTTRHRGRVPLPRAKRRSRRHDRRRRRAGPWPQLRARSPFIRHRFPPCAPPRRCEKRNNRSSWRARVTGLIDREWRSTHSLPEAEDRPARASPRTGAASGLWNRHRNRCAPLMRQRCSLHARPRRSRFLPKARRHARSRRAAYRQDGASARNPPREANLAEPVPSRRAVKEIRTSNQAGRQREVLGRP